MKHYYFFIIIFLFLSCQKKVTRSVTISKISTSFSEISINANYVLGKKDALYGGICYDTITNPTISSFGNLGIENISHSHDFNINSLNSNKTYFIKGYLVLKSGETIYSSEISITTDPAPEAPCETLQNTVNFSGVNAGMTSFYSVPFSSDYYHITATNGWGYEVTMKFADNNVPSTGIYNTTDVSVYGLIPTNLLTCNYVIADGQNIYINNYGNNKLSISFCELTLSNYSTNCGSNTFTLSGEIRNF